MEIANFCEYKKIKLVKEYISLKSATDAILFLKKTNLEDAEFIDKVLNQVVENGHEEDTSLSWDIVEQAINDLKVKGEF